MKFFNSHLKKNVLARLFSFIVNFFSQILLVPFFLTSWNVNIYADWILVTSLVSVLAMSDIGFNDVISNKFIVSFTDKDFKACNEAVNNNFFLLLVTFVVALLVYALSVYYLDIRNLLNIKVLNSESINWILFFFIIQIFFGQFSTVLNALYKANSKSFVAFFLDDFTRILEILITIFCLIKNIKIEILVLLLTVPKLLIFIFKILDTRKMFQINLNFKFISFTYLSRILLPSLSFMAFPIGYALLNQGITIVVGKFYSPLILILFTSTRTLCNVIKSFSGILAVAVWPEFSLAFARKDFFRMKVLHRKVFRMSLLSTVVLSSLILVFGQYIFNFWIGEKFVFDTKLAFILLLSIFFGILWYNSSVVLMSTNNHSAISIYFLLLNILNVIIIYVLTKFNFKIHIVALSFLIVDLPLSIIVITKTFNFLNDNYKKFFKSIFING